MGSHWDYSRWSKLFDYQDIEAFEGEVVFEDGVHRVATPKGNYIELLVARNPFEGNKDTAIQVYFSGALSKREGSQGPYFSGRRMSARIGNGYLAFSDPLLYQDSELALGWYTGESVSGTQMIMARMSAHLGAISGRQLMFIGGSGGGYASLVLSSLVPGTKAFVWNPQTRILDYVPQSVKEYLKVSVEQDFHDRDSVWKQEAAELLDAGGIIHDLADLEQRGQFIYLQNYNDWHLAKHASPFATNWGFEERGQGIYTDIVQRAILVGRYGHGHVVPSNEILDFFVKTYSRRDLEADAVCSLFMEGLAPPGFSDDLPALLLD